MDSLKTHCCYCADPDGQDVCLATAVDARLALMQQEIDGASKVWRCFHCGEACKSEVDARNHFGSMEGSEPACSIKGAGEFALLQALRNAEDRLQRYMAEDSDTLRAMSSMQSDHQQALRREEERGYAKGVADMRSENALLQRAVEWCLENGASRAFYPRAGKRHVLVDGQPAEVPAEFAEIVTSKTREA